MIESRKRFSRSPIYGDVHLAYMVLLTDGILFKTFYLSGDQEITSNCARLETECLHAKIGSWWRS